ALVHRRETEQVPALYLTRFACGGLGKPSRVLAADAGASDGDGLSHCRIIFAYREFQTIRLALAAHKIISHRSGAYRWLC
ncbi:MAG: hypothetical protein WCF50_25715, partial [Pseudolabrys sp.]